jgi:hypothetical protein
MAKFLVSAGGSGGSWTGEHGSTIGKSYGSEAEAEAAEAKAKKVSGYAEGGDTTKLNSQLTAAKQNLIKQQTLLANEQAQTAKMVAEGLPVNVDGTNAAQQKVTDAQNKVNELQGELSNIVQGAVRQKTADAIVDPASLTTDQTVDKITPTSDQLITTGTGELGPAPQGTVTKVGDADQAITPDAITTSKAEVDTSKSEVQTEVDKTQAAQGTLSEGSTFEGVTMEPTDTAVGNVKAAQGSSIVMNNPVTREIQEGEIISGSADAVKAAAFTEQVQAAEATPSEKATVKGQLDGLMADFEEGATPAWAAGALRNATAAMTARGLGASSMAGQALVQAAMEAALPIAAADAQTVAGFEMANLSNRQQRAMLAAEQRAAFMGQEFDQNFQAKVQNASRIADVANMNFTAEQQVALENSRNANTVNMANLNNRQAMVMAEASAIANLELSNLSNQQQAAAQNAQSFLQMDMSNLSNRQQTEIFKSQSMIQSILTDTAAQNAANQFNATSENQTNQFMANMKSQVEQFNVSQSNAMAQFDADATNAMTKFNTDVINQRDQFNATNQLVIAQANASWRQKVATTNSAAQNIANAESAKTANAFTASTIDQIWQRERDMMSMAWKSAESSSDRANNIIMSQMGITAQKEAIDAQIAADNQAAIGGLFGKLLFHGITGGAGAAV